MSSNKQCLSWDFRANLSYYSIEEIFKFMDKNFSSWVFQPEEGKKGQETFIDDETGKEIHIEGYKHYQMRVRLRDKKALYKKGVQQLFLDSALPIANYIAPTSNKVHSGKNFNYVLKDDTRIGEHTYSDKNFKTFLTIEQIFNAEYYDAFYKDPTIYKDPYFKLKYDDLRPFQRQILESGNIYNDREINIVVNYGGKIGKSSITDYIAYGNHGICLEAYIDSDKISQSLCDELIETKNYTPKLILFDIPRCLDVSKLSSFLRVVETIKQGRCSDPRNKLRKITYQKPAIWILTNSTINIKLLSLDRWKIWEIEDKNEPLKLLSIDEYKKKCYMEKFRLEDEVNEEKELEKLYRKEYTELKYKLIDFDENNDNNCQ
jgi:hypothetical protein